MAGMSQPPQPYTCPRCGSVSHNPDDLANRYCGRCHLFMADMLRLRVWVAGALVDTRWVASEQESGWVATAHGRITEAADRAGVVWMVEVFDPAEPPARAHMRFGTDAAGMVQPYEVERWPWEQ